MEERLMEARKRIIVALDVPTSTKAFELIEQLTGKVGLVKIGMQLYYARDGGYEFVEEVRSMGMDVMLDLKLNDIPETMCKAILSVKDLKPKFITVHTSSGHDHLRACVDAAGPDIGILGVSVLTSVGPDQYIELVDKEVFDRRIPPGGFKSKEEQDEVLTGLIRAEVLKRISIARTSTCAGAVCSGQELSHIPWFTDWFKLVVPGIRPAGANANDQRRVMTPGEAIRAKASYLVIGRPITQPEDGSTPAEAADKIAEEISQALQSLAL